jgi:hypothetical protein
LIITKEKQSPQRNANTVQQNQDMAKRSFRYYTSLPSVTFCTFFANQGIATPLPAVSSPATIKGKRAVNVIQRRGAQVYIVLERAR